MSKATSGVARNEETTPLTVLEDPKRGRPAVGQHRAAVERLSKLIAESFLDEHRRSVGHDEKDQQLKD